MKTILLIIPFIIAMCVTNDAQTKVEKTRMKVFSDFEKMARRNKKVGSSLLLIHSDSLNIHWKTCMDKDPEADVHPDQPYHFASIGKTITSVMIAILYEKGFIDYENKISRYLDKEILKGLHVYRGRDYSGQIMVKHLLNHTSGLADYYTDKNDDKVSVMDLMIKEPDHFWTPIETIEWTRQNLDPFFAPGEGFHYSDTNYQLLGLIIESITQRPMHESLSEYIFDPLGMDDTYQLFYSEPRNKRKQQIVNLYHNGLNLSEATSISLDWAGGGIVSTSEDMLKFIRAVNENQIITKETFQKMQEWVKMGPGLFYGYGLMNFRFMMSPKEYDIWGNSGSIGAFMYYNPGMDVYMIGSFHKLNYHAPPIMFIARTLRKIKKLYN